MLIQSLGNRVWRELRHRLAGLIRSPRSSTLAIGRSIRRRLFELMHAGDLDALGLFHGTDKVIEHAYGRHYRRHFAPLRKRRLNLLEIGVGGYVDPDSGGDSLRMWKAYFPNSVIHGIDVFDKRRHEEARIRIYQGSQTDRDFLLRTCREIGPLDIVIDDGSHIADHVIFTFNTLFPLLADDGIYVVEDTQTSYWRAYGGDPDDVQNPRTTMNFFKGLADRINHAEIPRSFVPTELDRTVVAIHFYHNLIFVEKGSNDEGSTRVGRSPSGEVADTNPI